MAVREMVIPPLRRPLKDLNNPATLVLRSPPYALNVESLDSSMTDIVIKMVWTSNAIYVEIAAIGPATF
ncbi:MAG: hypothetical protein ABSF44_10555 [Candidatus Bathyarchaeia archaeon]